MRRSLAALAALFTLAGAAHAQTPVRLKPYVGAFTPMLPVVAVNDGHNPDVEMQSAPAVGMELEAVPRDWLRVYGGVTWTAPRLSLSGAMVTSPVNGASTGASLLIPTAGVIVAPRVGGLGVRPTLRLGAGAKRYHFDLVEQRHAVTDFTGDLGVGLAGADEGPVGVQAEARWLPSRFTATNLPVPVAGHPRQDQNDWLFQVSVRFRP
ncbi:MAG TPA: hypothetical protein VFJ82_27215 [Longimicrobium sp.]|nr:hypothetical protein [Longimicrobium sp.]